MYSLKRSLLKKYHQRLGKRNGDYFNLQFVRDISIFGRLLSSHCLGSGSVICTNFSAKLQTVELARRTIGRIVSLFQKQCIVIYVGFSLIGVVVAVFEIL